MVLLQTYLLVKAVGHLHTLLLHLLALRFDFSWLLLFLQLNTSCKKLIVSREAWKEPSEKWARRESPVAAAVQPRAPEGLRLSRRQPGAASADAQKADSELPSVKDGRSIHTGGEPEHLQDEGVVSVKGGGA